MRAALKLRKVLVANRGEIACRIMRTARRMGIATVAAYSDADAGALHVREADEAVRIGPAPAIESYLAIERIIDAARSSGADCVHPGYGFLSENPDFAEAVRAAGLVFIGPSAAAMRSLGDKARAKALAESLSIPVVPGYRGESQDAKALIKEARRIGFPVMIKAAAGGGGRGMRVVEKADDLAAALDGAVREAVQAFGDGRVLIEKLVTRPRHIEIQVFADAFGNVVHLYERDCTLQRRHQKVIEEAPAAGMAAGLRGRLTEAAVRLAKAAKYENAGTVEFLVEGGVLADDARSYFIEVNTRLQVEHPVTEAVTGLDLVEWQLRVAAGEPLPLRQDEIRVAGHAIEARLCAEDPSRGFAPSVGRIEAFEAADLGAGTRLETGIEAGSEITPYYDSMLAKLIVHGPDRASAIARLRGELSRIVLLGPRWNGRFLADLIALDSFAKADIDTGVIARHMTELAAARVSDTAVRRGVELLLTTGAGAGNSRSGVTGAADPWSARDSFQLGPPRSVPVSVSIDGETRTLRIEWTSCPDGAAVATVVQGPAEADKSKQLSAGGRITLRTTPDGRVLVGHDLLQAEIARPRFTGTSSAGAGSQDSVLSPIAGRIAKLFVAEGEAVAPGQRIAIVEAMKMEHGLHTTRAGRIARLAAREGQQVAQGVVIAELAPEEAP